MRIFLTIWGIWLIAGISTTSLEAQCKIDSINFELRDCDDGLFYVFLDFNYDSVGEGFVVAGNGHDYGTFSYSDLPIKIGPLEGDGETSYEFVVTNKGDPNCSDFLEVGVIECEVSTCKISELIVQTGECHPESHTYEAHINFTAQNFKQFDLYANDSFIGFYHVEDLPLKIPSFPAGGEAYDKIKVCANDQSECCQVLEFEAPGCMAECGFHDLTAEAVECDSNIFYVKLRFSQDGEHVDSFGIKGNGEDYGLFHYDNVPIILGPFSQFTDQVREFILTDNENSNCRAHISLQNGDCGCTVDGIELHAGDCTSDTTYLVELDFQTEHFDSFSIYANGEFFMNSNVNLLPLRIENFPSHGLHKVEIKIKSIDGHCRIIEHFEAPICSNEEECFVDLYVEPTECDGNSFYAKINFEHLGAHSDFFEVKGNGHHYGKYKYEELPVKIGPLKGNGNIFYEFAISDLEFENCHLSFELGAISCECSINDLKLEVGECTSDTTYRLFIDFNSVDSFFDIYANGVFFGHYDIDQLPLMIEQFPTNGKGVDVIKICAGESEDCCQKEEIKAPECLTKGCFVELITEITECDSSGSFYFFLDFDHVGAHSEFFLIKGNDQEFEFSYRDLPVKVGPFKGGETFYSLELCDGENHECHVTIPIGRIICDEQCVFGGIDVEVVECLSDGRYLIQINSFDTEFKALDFSFNDEYLGFFKQDNFPLQLEVNRGEADFDKLQVCVSDNTTCYQILEMTPPSCDSACHIFDMTVDTTPCENDSFSVLINFNYDESISGHFSVAGNGMLYGLFSYDELPITIGPFAGDGETVYEFVVHDSIDRGCSDFVDLGKIGCASGVSPAQRLLILESSEGRVHLQIPDFITERTKVDIFNVQGHHLVGKLMSSSSDPIILHVPMLHQGMYILHMKSLAGVIHNDKFIIH